MIELKKLQVWLVTGSQRLYGPEALKQVAANAREVAEALNAGPAIPASVVCMPVVKQDLRCNEVYYRLRSGFVS